MVTVRSRVRNLTPAVSNLQEPTIDLNKDVHMSQPPAPEPEGPLSSPTPGVADGSPIPPAPKRKGPSKWIGLGCFGCGALVLLVVIIMIIASAVSGGGDDAAPETETTQAEETTEEAPETTPEEESDEAPEDPAEDPQAWADGVANEVIVANAGEGKKWADTCGGSGWCAYVTDVSADNVGDLKVTLQVTPGATENEELARSTASFIVLSAADDHPELSWVEVYDGTGVIIDQFQRSDFGK